MTRLAVEHTFMYIMCMSELEGFLFVQYSGPLFDVVHMCVWYVWYVVLGGCEVPCGG